LCLLLCCVYVVLCWFFTSLVYVRLLASDLVPIDEALWVYLTYGYGSIPINTILVGWTSIYQLFWCSPGVQGFDTLPYVCDLCHNSARSSWNDGCDTHYFKFGEGHRASVNLLANFSRLHMPWSKVFQMLNMNTYTYIYILSSHPTNWWYYHQQWSCLHFAHLWIIWYESTDPKTEAQNCPRRCLGSSRCLVGGGSSDSWKMVICDVAHDLTQNDG